MAHVAHSGARAHVPSGVLDLCAIPLRGVQPWLPATSLRRRTPRGPLSIFGNTHALSLLAGFAWRYATGGVRDVRAVVEDLSHFEPGISGHVHSSWSLNDAWISDASLESCVVNH